jgi:hypothetical protein
VQLLHPSAEAETSGFQLTHSFYAGLNANSSNSQTITLFSKPPSYRIQHSQHLPIPTNKPTIRTESNSDSSLSSPLAGFDRVRKTDRSGIRYRLSVTSEKCELLSRSQVREYIPFIYIPG